MGVGGGGVAVVRAGRTCGEVEGGVRGKWEEVGGEGDVMGGCVHRKGEWGGVVREL